MSKGFAAGLAARTVDASSIGQIMAGMRGFAPASPGGDARTAAPEPRHFQPAAPGANPTAGWDMFDADADGHAVEMPDAAEVAIEAARAEGYALGIAAGEAAAHAAQNANDEATAMLTAALSRLRPFDQEQLAQRLGHTVLHLVKQMVGEAAVDGERLAARIKAAAALLSDSAGAGILHLNPADLPLVEGLVPEPLFAIADPALPRGSLLLESRDAVIEDGPDQWLQQLSAALDRVPLPGAPSC